MSPINILPLLILVPAGTFGVYHSPVIAQQSVAAPNRIDLSGTELDFARKGLVDRQTQPLSCGFRPLGNRMLSADIVFVVEPLIGFPPDGTEKTDVSVAQVLKRSNSIHLQVGDVLTLPIAVIKQDQRWSLVFCTIDGSRGVGVTEIQPISEAYKNYFINLSRLSGRSERLHFLIHAEETGNSSISSNALGELQAISDSAIERDVGPLTRTRVLQRLRATKLPPARRNFYLKLLGFAGNASDSELLEQYVFPGDKQPLTFLQNAAVAYLRLGGEAARHRFVEHYFTASKAANGAQAKMKLPQAFAAYSAVRQLRQEKAMRSTVDQADRFIFENTVLGDLVLADAMKERNDRFVDAAVVSYRRQPDTSYLRISILAYLAMVVENSKSAKRVQRLQMILDSARRDEPKQYEKAMVSMRLNKQLWNQLPESDAD